MRLHELRITAIGPFIDEQVIDFERLGASGLFLLEGPTGVGKSTVLDAVTFALYGNVTGSASDAARLCSDFAEPGTTPHVQLELSVRGQRMRITRTPEHERPKRRGVGTIKERPTVHLERWQDGAWVSVSARQDEVGTTIGEQLGLTREQFRQVVLLPQGEFATFLRADDDGRRAVLVKLFGTQFFERVAAALQQRAAQARSQLNACEAMLEGRIAAAWEASGREFDDDPELPLTWEQQVADLESVQRVTAGQASVAARAAADAIRAEAAARLVADEAQDVVDRVVERQAVLAELAAVETHREEHEQRVRRLTHARRARPVRPLLELLDAARSRAAETVARLSQLGVAAAAEEARPAAEALRATATAAERTVAGLGHVLALEAGLAEARASLASAEAQLVAEQEGVEQLRQRAERLPDELAETARHVQQMRDQVSAGEVAQRALVAAERRVQAADEAAETLERVGVLRVEERAARRRHEAARDHVAVIVDQRLAGLQGELAAKLVSGDPCLVCGSREHPAPVATERFGVTEERLREAEQERDEAWVSWENAARSVAAAEAKLAGALAVADGVSAVEAAALVSELTATVAAGSAAGASLTGLLHEETALREAASALQDDLIGATARLTVARSDATRLRTELDASEAKVAAARDGHPTVAERCSTLAADAVSARAGAEALEAHQRAEEAADSASGRAVQEAVAAGFDDLDQARRWVLPEVELGELEAAVLDWEERRQVARARLTSDQLQAVEELSAEWVDRVAAAAEGLLDQAVGRTRALAERATRTQQSAEQLERLLVTIRQLAADQAQRAAETEELSGIDAHVRGVAGSPRMTLSTFVLRYWFEQVVAAANVRLQAMSNGKYELRRVDHGARATTRVGLGLTILDRHTGKERGTDTLSGGESFYTSLSLALGLADVVVAEAGGAQLDTLFIDEGFGTLDADTLDEVMTVIDDLRGHGRVVGVVSHVAELKERIAERLSIRRTRPDGPSAITVVA